MVSGLIELVEFVGSTVGVVMVLVALVLPVGTFLTGFVPHGLGSRVLESLSLALGVIVLAMLSAILALLGVDAHIQDVFFVMFGALGCFWYVASGQRGLLEHWDVYLAQFLVVLLSSALVALPDGSIYSVQPHVSSQLQSFPADNVIAYNWVRYLREGIPFEVRPVLGDWSASDRTPLASLVINAVFAALSLKDTVLWTEGGRGIYFVFQSAMAWLNALSLVLVMLVSHELYGKRASYVAFLLISSSYFFLASLAFTWPKLLTAFFVLSAVWLWLSLNRGSSSNCASVELGGCCFLTGALLAGAMLSHELALFAVVAALCVFTFDLMRSSDVLREKIVRLSWLISGFLVTYMPWKVFCHFVVSSGKGPLYHLFCYLGPAEVIDSSGSSMFSEVAGSYWREHSLGEVIRTRLGNLYYPFSLEQFDVGGSSGVIYLGTWGHFVTNCLYQLGWSLGLVLLLAFVGLWQYRDKPMVTRSFAVGFGSLCIASLSAGCNQATANHVWAYTAYLACFIPAIGAVIRFRPVSYILVGLLVGWQSFTSAVAFLFFSPLNPWLHGSYSYFFILTLIGFAILLVFTVAPLWIGHCPSKSESEGGAWCGKEFEEPSEKLAERA